MPDIISALNKRNREKPKGGRVVESVEIELGNTDN